MFQKAARVLGTTVFLLYGAMPACAQGPGGAPLDLLDLARLKTYSAYRTSSNNLYVDSNDDSKRPIPGETLVLADLRGPGMITHIWITVADNEYAWPRLLRLRVYYDGEKTPSVDVPLGDFFGVGHGFERNLNSMMVRDASEGRARNCYWAMPFKHSCRITVTNEGRHRVNNFYYHVDWQKRPSLPPDVAYFHAYYRQAAPPPHGKNYEILNVRGRGHYVGTVLSVIQSQVGWFGEGDDLFYVDGEKTPRIEGTGSEDYFNDAWSFRVSDGIWTGVPVAEGEGVGARLAGYRWHVPDPIPFTKSLRVEIEHKGWTFNPDGSVRSAFEERPDFFSSVAYWYQQGFNQDLPEPPFGQSRLPQGNARQIEVENEVSDVTAQKGEVSVQREVFWGKDLLFFKGEGPGARMDIPIDVPEDGRYEVVAQIAEAPDYGDYTAALDGKTSQDAEVFHNYLPEVYVAADRLIGWFDLMRGRHALTLTCVGKSPQSEGYNLGVDDVVLAKVRSTEYGAEKPAWPPRSPHAPAGIVYRGWPLSYYLAELKTLPADRRADVLRAIGSFGRNAAPAVQDLASRLSEANPETANAAAWALSEIGPPAAPAVHALAVALAAPDPRTRGLAALALRNLGSDSNPALPALVKALEDPDSSVRSVSADALGAIGPAAKDAVGPLIRRLQVEAEEVQVRRSIASALGNIGPAAREALPALREAEKSPRVAWASEEAILKIQGQHVPTWH